MEFIQQYAKELFALLIPLITWFLNNLFKARAKLQLASPHGFTFLVPEPLIDDEGKTLSESQSVLTQSHIITNPGRETATNVEIVFNWKPRCINIWPVRHYEEKTEGHDRYVMIFDSLAPKEKIGFELLSINGKMPALINARSDQCTAITIDMFPQPLVSTWKIRLAVTLMFLGFSSAIYIAVLVLQFLILATPYGH